MYTVISDVYSPIEEAIQDSQAKMESNTTRNDTINDKIYANIMLNINEKNQSFNQLNADFIPELMPLENYGYKDGDGYEFNRVNGTFKKTSSIASHYDIVELPGFPTKEEDKWFSHRKNKNKLNNEDRLNTDLPTIFQKKISNLRDNAETIMVPPFQINLFGKTQNSYIALIRINNNYKLISCKSNEEFNLIKKLHEIIYGQGKHFNLEYELIKDAQIGYLTDDLDNYGFLKNEDIQEELSLIGENIKKLCDVKSFLGYKVSTTKNNIINVLPSFQSQISSNKNTNEILGYDKRFGEDFEMVEPGFEMSRTMDIWYNNMFMTGFTLEWEIFLKECNITTEQIKQLGYFKEITKFKNTDISGIVIQELNELFSDQLFKDIKEFQEKVDVILTRQNKQCPNLAKIKQYIIANYDLDDNVEHRIQFSNILNEVIKGLNVASEFYEMMKKSLPLVLAELNLNKKRYASGFFWYGLVRKNESNARTGTSIDNINNTTPNLNTLIQDEKEGTIKIEKKYNELIKERGYSNAC